MEFHELASIFPLMGKEEYQALVRDIERNGLLEPIWLYEDKIIDGRNRYQACLELQITPEFRTWQGRGSPLAFVISLNLSRRHLTSSQKAVVALEVEKHLASEARQQQGRRNDLLQKTAKSLQPLHAAAEAGKLVGTNRHYVITAKQIKKAAPELIETVRPSGPWLCGHVGGGFPSTPLPQPVCATDSTGRKTALPAATGHRLFLALHISRLLPPRLACTPG